MSVGLALLIPLLPYVFEMIALRRLPTALFGVIMSLEPAIAALLGFLILGQALARPASSRSRSCVASAGRDPSRARAAASIVDEPARIERDA